MLKRIMLVLMLVSMLAVAGVAYAITYGQPDGELHPGVGAIIYTSPSGAKFPICSGALISPTVFLTAAHCDLSSYTGTNRVEVSFNTDLSQDAIYGGSVEFYSGTFIPDARYTWKQNDSHDIAVIVLDQAVQNRPVYALPTLGQFDDLAQGAQFTAVGYGGQEPVEVPGVGVVNGYLDVREYSVSSLNAVNKAWLRLSQNAATGDSGTCFGDSGGPNFLGAGANETNIIAATTITGDAICRATNVTYRLDTVAAREFLGMYVALP